MISRYLYEEGCKAADIPITRTERTVLDSVTVNGWFDEDAYLEAMGHAKPRVYVTKNQREILRWCPQKSDDFWISDEKNMHRRVLVKKMRTANQKGEGI